MSGEEKLFYIQRNSQVLSIYAHSQEEAEEKAEQLPERAWATTFDAWMPIDPALTADV